MKPIYKATWITFITILLNMDWFLVLICGRILVFSVGSIEDDTHQIGVVAAKTRLIKRRVGIVRWATESKDIRVYHGYRYAYALVAGNEWWAMRSECFSAMSNS